MTDWADAKATELIPCDTNACPFHWNSCRRTGVCDMLTDVAAALRAGPPWQDIKDAPRGAACILFYPAVSGRNSKAEWITIGFPGSTHREPTHFMPLPAPPAPQTKE